MALSVKKNMNEEMVFAQELSDDELETVSGGLCGLNGKDCDSMAEWESHHCINIYKRDIYEGAFPNCAATVEDGSICWDNDACSVAQVKYTGMKDCSKAWR